MLPSTATLLTGPPEHIGTVGKYILHYPYSDQRGQNKPRLVGAGGTMPPPPLFWQISETYLNPQIMSTTLLLDPPDFQTFLRP